MAQPKNTLARVVVPLVAIAIGLGVVASVFLNSKNQKAPAPVTVTPAPSATGTTGAGAPSVPVTAPTGPTVASTPTGSAAGAAPAPAAPPSSGGISALDGLRALPVDGDSARGFAPIGSLDEAQPLPGELRFSTLGAGIRSLRLARHYETIQKKEHALVQHEQVHVPAPGAEPAVLTPMAAIAVEVDGTIVALLGAYESENGTLRGTPVWRQLAPGAFEALVVNGAGDRVLRVERRYELEPGSYVVRLRQKVENLSGRAVKVRWTQFGPTDLPQDSAYGGDKRRVRFGYLLDPARQGADPTVLANDFVWGRDTALAAAKDQGFETVRPLWPNETSVANAYRLVWDGVTNRYFATALHPLLPAGSGPDAKVNPLAAGVDRVAVTVWQDGKANAEHSMMALRTTSVEVPLGPGAVADLSQGVYAGPLSSGAIANDPAASAAGLDGLVVYNFGGMCGWCTFAFLTHGLLAILHGLHFLVRDWGVSIILLVCCVRLVLHPVTKWSQIRMQRFGKQMQGMAPKQKKIQEKYGGDPQKMREEMARLWREEGVNPAGMLGCLPMFLQTPVWIALYATLYFAFDLRQQPAFYGVFQAIQPQSWPTWWFLGDLAEPDRLFYLGHPLFTIPWVGWVVHSVNILPVILAVVFFIQQKYLTPPAAPGSMTPEQEQQQRIMKWMMVFMFPLLMYGAPCGLTLYFIVNSTLGILESRYIRAHMAKYDAEAAARGNAGKKKPGGFMARLQAMAEERQQQMMRGKGMGGGQWPRKKV